MLPVAMHIKMLHNYAHVQSGPWRRLLLTDNHKTCVHRLFVHSVPDMLLWR